MTIRQLTPAPDRFFDGIAGADGAWRPVRPFFLSADRFREMGELTLRASRLVLDACRRRAATAGELRRALAVPAGRWPLLGDDEPLGDHLLAAVRPDILVQGGTPKFVELNIDSALGGASHAALLGERFLALYRDTHGLSVPPSAVDTRSEAVRTTLRLTDGARVVVPAFSAGATPGLEDLAAFTAWMRPVCESAGRQGLDAVTYPLDRLATDESRRLLVDGRPVDAVLRMFVSHSQPPSAGMEALVRALRAGTVRMFTSEAAMLLAHKLTLAWLWQDADELPSADRDFIHRHIPWTCDAGDRTARPSERRAELVLKPADGYGGSGVVLGAAVGDEEWRAALDRAARDGGHIFQEYIAGDLVPLDFRHAPSGEIRTAEVPYVIGPYVFGGQPSSVLVRHGTPDGGTVLNARHGAFLNTALLTVTHDDLCDL
ncbi:hypothetical protein ACGFYQ_32820 [Streptomyces sp. NPDC048258]|uniref:hypothetical protein n=1 Tax=Streptomyces sp. NPDC048258 TaxID=3365527 RepID=UPI00371E8014